MYPSYLQFGPELRERDEQKLWFFDQMHNPEPLYPFDLMMPESWLVALNQYTTRVWTCPRRSASSTGSSTATCT